jgi:hypothetical protein
MKEIVEKLKRQEEIMAREKGPFDLFALFLREDAPGKWDLVIAADWVENNKELSFKYVAGIIQRALSKDELLQLSRIVLIDESNPALEAFHKAMQIEHGDAEIQDSNFFGLQIKHAHLITSRRRKDSAPDKPIKPTQ